MKPKFPKYIVTDLDSIVKRLGPIISRLEIEFLDFKEFFQSELFRNSSGFLNVIFYLTVSDLKKTQKEIHQQFQRNPLILSRFILNEI